MRELKIDRSFVAGLPGDDGNRAIVATVLALSQAFGLEVVAEGVEDEAQATALMKLGGSQAQGYLFARLGPLADLPL